MEIELAEQRLFALRETLPLEELTQRAMDRRMNAISSGISSLLQRPKPEDVLLLGSERRLEPFWHVAGRGRYVYDRAREYSVPVVSSEVRGVTVSGTDAPVMDSGRARAFTITVMEHCVEEPAAEIFVSGVTGNPVPDGASVARGVSDEVAEPETLAADGTVVVPPEQRASFVVRSLLGELMKPVQADAVLEERMLVERIDLYYRPVRAFEFYWKPRDKRGVVEVDGLTGQVTIASSLSANIAKVLTRENVFDIGADAAGLLIPGGSIAVKVARVAIDHASRPPAP